MISKQLLEHRVSLFAETCRMRGLRMTPQRVAIYEALAATTVHPSAEEIYGEIRERMPNVSLDTVYRTLHFFQEEGLVDRVDAGCSTARFDAGMDQHHHFICKRCGRITDFEDSTAGRVLPAEVEAMGRVEVVRLVVRGVCAECVRSGNA